jgi:glucokinase
MDLIADIGATNARCALIDGDRGIVCSHDYKNADYASLDRVLLDFVNTQCSVAPERAALAIAAPLAGDEVVMTNIGWHFRQSELQHQLTLRELVVLNDFEALAYALPKLRENDCLKVGGGEAVAGANMAVLGPGSGLGVASITRLGTSWAAVAGEGGHVSMPAMTPIEQKILAEHGDDNGHCAAERLLSGPGLVRIHSTLARLAGQTETSLTPAEVTQGANKGDEIARQTFDVFFAMLGTVAGNLALTVGARGGVFIGGGIVPRVLDAFRASDFRERFIAKGRYRGYLDAIPTAVITAEHPAFIGLKARLAAL